MLCWELRLIVWTMQVSLLLFTSTDSLEGLVTLESTRLQKFNIFVYVIACVAEVFEINCASNVGRKLIVQGA